MKRITFILAMSIGLFARQTPLWAIPSQITYQGTLKEQSLPVNATKSMQFRITNQNGSQVYWSSPAMNVNVINGLFTVQLNPTMVAWETVTPYIEISVEGQALSPREAISATVYATVAGSVIDASVGPAKVAAGYGLVPRGAILMFAGPCPSGWTRFSALDNRFPQGNSSFGATGGSATHSHPISADGNHSHGGLTGQGNAPAIHDAGNNFGGQNGGHRHPISSDGSHDHSGSTSAGNSLPPFLGMVFCQKD